MWKKKGAGVGSERKVGFFNFSLHFTAPTKSGLMFSTKSLFYIYHICKKNIRQSQKKKKTNIKVLHIFLTFALCRVAHKVMSKMSPL